MRKEEKRRQLVEEALPEAGLSVFHPSLSPFPSSLLLIHPSIALWIGDALVWFCPCFALLCHHVTLPANKMNMNMKMREKRRNWQCQMPKAATVKKKKRHRAHHHSSRTPTPYTYSRILVYYYQMVQYATAREMRIWSEYHLQKLCGITRVVAQRSHYRSLGGNNVILSWPFLELIINWVKSKAKRPGWKRKAFLKAWRELKPTN